MKTFSAVLALGSLLTFLCLSAPAAQAQSNHSRPTVNINLSGSHQPTHGYSQRTGNDHWRGSSHDQGWYQRMQRERMQRERLERERREHNRDGNRGRGWGRGR